MYINKGLVFEKVTESKMGNKFSKYSDRKLVSMLQSDKETSARAFTEIHDRYSAKVYSYLKCMLNDIEDVNDLYQETFIRLYKNLQPEIDSFNLPAYLISTARNLFLNNIRNKKKTVSIDDINDMQPELTRKIHAIIRKIGVNSLYLW